MPPLVSACKLCINHFVGPRPKIAWALDTPQNIGPANPSLSPERALDDNLTPANHGVPRSGYGVMINASNTFNHGYLEAF